MVDLSALSACCDFAIEKWVNDEFKKLFEEYRGQSERFFEWKSLMAEDAFHKRYGQMMENFKGRFKVS